MTVKQAIKVKFDLLKCKDKFNMHGFVDSVIKLKKAKTMVEHRQDSIRRIMDEFNGAVWHYIPIEGKYMYQRVGKQKYNTYLMNSTRKKRMAKFAY